MNGFRKAFVHSVSVLLIAGLLLIPRLGVPSAAAAGPAGASYDGRFVSGAGDSEYLELIDRSFGFFKPNPDTQNIAMLYTDQWNGLYEGMSWIMWWCQNSYGTTYNALPYLEEPWLSFLQTSQDLWFDTQCDGKTVDAFGTTAPAGCLHDCAGPEMHITVQGDLLQLYGREITDFSYGFTAADIVMQGELLLISRDTERIKHYLPKLEAASAFIETARDAKTGLFLVGPGADLLAPAYGAVRNAEGKMEKAYLTETSVTHIAAMARMAELCKLVGEMAKAQQYAALGEKSRAALSQMLTEEGYFMAFKQQDGKPHGVYGQEQYGYFLTTPNVDAVALRVVDDARAAKIHAKIDAIPELRPHDFMLPNYPTLDDSPEQFASTTQSQGLMIFGRWVNGGVWTTLEGRGVLAFSRVNAFDDVLRSGRRFMEMARHFKLDAPLVNFGADPWNDTATSLCYDSLAVPAAVARGVFEYVYSADALALYPHLPPTVTSYTQKQPIRFGTKRLLLRVENGGSEIKGLSVNGEAWPVEAVDHVVLPFEKLPELAQVAIIMDGAPRPFEADAAGTGTAVWGHFAPLPGEVPAELKAPQARFSALQAEWQAPAGMEYEAAHIAAILAACEAATQRAARNAAGSYADLTPEKRNAIYYQMVSAAGTLAAGFDKLMQSYATSDVPARKQLAELYVSLAPPATE